MKNILSISIIILAFNASIFSQECKYLVNQEDKFTNTTTKETEAVELCSFVKPEGMKKLKEISMILRVENGKKYFTLYYIVSGGGASPAFVGNGASKLILLLDDNSKVELNMSGLMSDNRTKGPYKLGVLTHFEILEGDYAKLSTHNITDIRASSMVNPFDFKVIESVKTSFYFSCIK